MAAAGEPVEAGWVQLDQFTRWLQDHPIAAGEAVQEAGEVLVWHLDGQLALG